MLQGMQAVVPGVGVYLPAAHTEHVAPEFTLPDPGAHMVQSATTVRPEEFVEYPTGQLIHSVLPDALYVPCGQIVHVAPPSVLEYPALQVPAEVAPHPELNPEQSAHSVFAAISLYLLTEHAVHSVPPFVVP
jgi:hypothetical protein